MNILFISRLFPHSQGISGSVIIYNRIRYLAEAGHQVGLLSLIRNEDKPHISEVKPLLKEMELFDDDLLRKPFLRRTAKSMFSLLPTPFCDASLSPMRRKTGEMIERARYEVAIAEFSVMGQCLYENPWLSAVRRVLSCHECWTTGCLQAIRYHRWTLRNMMRRCKFDYATNYEFNMYHNMDHILVLTPEERYRLLKHEPNLRISVIPHGVDTVKFSPNGIGPRERIILFVGYYPNESNQDAVLWFARKVWPALKKRYADLKFYVVGRKPTPAIRELGRKDARIIVTGNVDDIRPYLARAQIFICPMRMGGGFRAKLLEAMAAGVPVVSSSLGAEGIVSWSGDTLLLADTSFQMLRSIRLLLDDDRLREIMAEKARKMVEERFSKERGMAALNNVLHQIVCRD